MIYPKLFEVSTAFQNLHTIPILIKPCMVIYILRRWDCRSELIFDQRTQNDRHNLRWGFPNHKSNIHLTQSWIWLLARLSSGGKGKLILLCSQGSGLSIMNHQQRLPLQNSDSTCPRGDSHQPQRNLLGSAHHIVDCKIYAFHVILTWLPLCINGPVWHHSIQR